MFQNFFMRDTKTSSISFFLFFKLTRVNSYDPGLSPLARSTPSLGLITMVVRRANKMTCDKREIKEWWGEREREQSFVWLLKIGFHFLSLFFFSIYTFYSLNLEKTYSVKKNLSKLFIYDNLFKFQLFIYDIKLVYFILFSSNLFHR